MRVCSAEEEKIRLINLKEIAKYKGTLYDSAAVDICLKLFKKNSFKFTDKNP